MRFLDTMIAAPLALLAALTGIGAAPASPSAERSGAAARECV